MGVLAAEPASDAAVEHRGDRVLAHRIRVRADRERGAAGNADARVIAGAGLRVDAEAFADDALALLHAPGDERLLAPRPIQRALALGDDDLGALVSRGEGFLEQVAHLVYLEGIRHGPGPLDPDATNRLFDGVLRRAQRIRGLG